MDVPDPTEDDGGAVEDAALRLHRQAAAAIMSRKQRPVDLKDKIKVLKTPHMQSEHYVTKMFNIYLYYSNKNTFFFYIIWLNRLVKSYLTAKYSLRLHAYKYFSAFF